MLLRQRFPQNLSAALLMAFLRFFKFNDSSSYQFIRGTLKVTKDAKLRSSQGITAPVLEPIWAGEAVRIVEDDSKWAKVTLLDGTEGYINKKLAFK